MNKKSSFLHSLKAFVNKPFASSPVPTMSLGDWSYKSEQKNQEPLHFVLSSLKVFSFHCIFSILGYVSMCRPWDEFFSHILSSQQKCLSDSTDNVSEGCGLAQRSIAGSFCLKGIIKTWS